MSLAKTSVLGTGAIRNIALSPRCLVCNSSYTTKQIPVSVKLLWLGFCYVYYDEGREPI